MPNQKSRPRKKLPLSPAEEAMAGKNGSFTDELALQSAVEDMLFPSGPSSHVFSVKELTWYIRESFASDPVLGHPVTVRGELSNVKRSSRGHIYFNLRDAEAGLSGILWASLAERLKFDLAEGLEVFATGTLEIYAPNGTYSLIVKKMEPVGVGALQLAFEQLKARLEAEGVFNPEFKKPLPEFPKRIGIVTAPTGAVIHDMLRVLKRKHPGLQVLLHPVPVQGEGAAMAIADAVRELDKPQHGLDVIIVARGGGSFEDLFCFSEEPVVRAIFQAKTPIITGIGHEPDYGLADAVADYSASTPTAAAEAAVPDVRQLREWTEEQRHTMAHALTRIFHTSEQHLDHLSTRFIERFEQFLTQYQHRLAQQETQLFTDFQRLEQKFEALIGKQASELEAFSPLQTLARGYSVVTRVGDKRVVRSIEDVSAGEKLQIRVSDGSITAEVIA